MYKFKASSDQEVVREDDQIDVEASGETTGNNLSVDSSTEENTELTELFPEDKTAREKRRAASRAASNQLIEDKTAREANSWCQELWRVLRLSCSCIYNPQNNNCEDLTVAFLEEVEDSERREFLKELDELKKLEN